MSKRLNLLSLLSETKKMVNFGTIKKGYFKEDAYRQVCLSYSQLDAHERYQYLKELSTMHDYTNEKYQNLLSKNTSSDILRVRRMYSIKELLQPKYREFFINLGRVSDGIKLLVDLRSDIIDIQKLVSELSTKEYKSRNQDQSTHSDRGIGQLQGTTAMDEIESYSTIANEEKPDLSLSNPDSELGQLMRQLASSESSHNLFVLNSELKDLINVWFAGGFCQLERVTWSSSCQLLQRISELEAVHPVKGWADIKRRVGPYRRCYVFTHPCMPNEPVVILHTALCPEVPSSIRDIVSRNFTKSASLLAPNTDVVPEDPSRVMAAIFYSISSPHRGLNGIDLGNTLIKRVVQQLRFEFPSLGQFCTLSPLPGFRDWLAKQISECLTNEVNNRIIATEEITDKHYTSLCNLLNPDQVAVLSHYYQTCTTKDLLSQLELRLSTIGNRFASTNRNLSDMNVDYSVMAWLLKTLAANYLCNEKHRGFAFDPVCNFHLKNGAVLWRINWLADSSPRGIQTSYGVMVNYRYYIEKTEKYSRQYLEDKVMQLSPAVIAILKGENTPKC